MPLLINNEIASQVLTLKECMDGLESVYKEEGRREAVNRNKSAIHVPTKDENLWYRYVTMEGVSRELGLVALRIKTDMVYWKPVNGIHRELWYTGRLGKYGGLVLLFSVENGELLAILNDGFVQHMRVVATYALGAKCMSRSDTRSVAVLGSGGMARGYLEALSLVRRIDRVKVFSPTPEHREDFAREMAERLQLDVAPARSIQEAVEGVDHLAAMTDAVDPVVYPDMLTEGMHLCTVTTQEMSRDAYGRIDRMVAHRTGISQHLFASPDQRPMQPGGSHGKTTEWESVVPVKHSFADVLLGLAPGRHGEKEVTYFVSEGMGTQFAAIGGLVYGRAKELGLGQELPLDWFLQDIRT